MIGMYESEKQVLDEQVVQLNDNNGVVAQKKIRGNNRSIDYCKYLIHFQYVL